MCAATRAAGVDAEGRALYEASYLGNAAVVGELVRRGVRATWLNEFGQTAVHYAAYGGHVGILRMLVEGAGGDANHHDNDGNTPLHFAAGANQLKSAEYLTRVGADATRVDNHGKTPLIDVYENNAIPPTEYADWQRVLSPPTTSPAPVGLEDVKELLMEVLNNQDAAELEREDISDLLKRVGVRVGE